ncbi:MAG TPA: molybdopterin-synthase adenylyltransferase MoeB [Gemmatimonadales bacterium]|nr:molybdopterin-synthase adenylyltransferase MoeB [Gemmatimonadales bacterium]
MTPHSRVPAALSDLSAEELQRYARHLILPEVGVEGQRKLKDARVLIVGLGGLGSPAALYLAAAGVGTLGLVDFDVVEYSNLQRQVLYATSAVGQAKLASAADRIRDVNPHVTLVHHEVHLASENALEVLAGYDVVLDGSDNFPTRYLVNDACALLGKPDVYGSIFRFDGQASVFWAARGPCYRCLYREPPPPELVPSCAEGGVLGVLPGIIGSIQALEAIKLILGEGESLVGRLLLFDALRLRFREVALERDPECPLCGQHPSIRGLIDYEAFCGVTEPAVPVGLERELEVRPGALRAELGAGRRLQLVDVREPFEWEICHIAGSVLIPLGELPARLGELESGAPIVAICHTGRRSLDAARFLRSRGFADARSLRGGVALWAEEVDPEMPRY